MKQWYSGFFLAGEVLQQLAVVAQHPLARAEAAVAEGLGVARQARRVDVLQGLLGEGFLAVEVVIEGALGDARGLDDLQHPGAVVATPGHDLGALGQDQFALVESVASHGTRGI